MTKILLIDDDKALANMYKGKFESEGFDMEIVLDAELAFDRIIKFKPDLILLDVMMPKLNGYEILKKLKSHSISKKIPVVLFTNIGSIDADLKKALSLGAADLVIKADIDPKDVVKKVKEILSK
jgi:two-component system alkaline phosphatase synthesis response regulator PhoP